MHVLNIKTNISENFLGSRLSSPINLRREFPHLLLCLSPEGQEVVESIKDVLNLIDPGSVYYSHPSQHATECHEDQQLIFS